MLVIAEAHYVEKEKLWILVKTINHKVLKKEVEFKKQEGLYKWAALMAVSICQDLLEILIINNLIHLVIPNR
jgi:hypothetical protein